MARKSRLNDIDAAKGIAIFLVVLGHIVARTPPEGHLWWSVLIRVIYSFHMPFFMYVAGCTAHYVYEPIDGIKKYSLFVRKKASRLILPYIIMGVIILLGKVGAMKIGLHVDNPVNSSADVIGVFLYPRVSYSSFLWFVYVLFELYLLLPLLELALSRLSFYLLILFVTLQFLEMTHLFALNSLAHSILFFSIGLMVMKNYDLYASVIDRYGSIMLGIFVLLLVVCYFSPAMPDLIMASLSIPALHYLVRARALLRSDIILLCGSYSFSIYLFNTICIGMTKALLFLAIDWNYRNFYFFIIVLTCAGIFFPIVITRCLNKLSPRIAHVFY